MIGGDDVPSMRDMLLVYLSSFGEEAYIPKIRDILLNHAAGVRADYLCVDGYIFDGLWADCF
jgi:hypothetical protein